MLTYLRIRGLALLSDAAMELGPGLTVLTGETGAGKSIIAEALLLLRGSRGRADLVRSGESSLRIDAQFDLSGAPLRAVESVAAQRQLKSDDVGGLLAQRVVQRTGRGRCQLQGELVPNAALSAVGAHLLAVCSQHEHHSLTSVSRHLDLLDAYAGLDDLVREYSVVWEQLRDVERQAAALVEEAGLAERRAELLRHLVGELSELAPTEGEWDELHARLELLSGATEHLEYAGLVRARLYDDDDAVVSRLSRLAAVAERGAAQSPHLQALASELRAGMLACEEAAGHASRLANSLEVDPSALKAAERRLDSLATIAVKHRVKPDRLPSLLDELSAELEDLESHGERGEALELRISELRSRAGALASVLSEQRRAASKRMGAALRTELDELCMTAARIEAQVHTDEEEFGPRGRDRVELHFSANSGEELAPLSQVASGGELSRVLLAIQGVLSRGDSVATYVFDEVDAGVGGAVAEAIGRRLRNISKQRQVICITHLPQIAAFGDAHFRVEKSVQAGRTVTSVEHLDEEESVEEIARMLAGARVTKSAREHARELRRAAHAAPLRVVAGAKVAEPAIRRSRKAGPARRACG